MKSITYPEVYLEGPDTYEDILNPSFKPNRTVVKEKWLEYEHSHLHYRSHGINFYGNIRMTAYRTKPIKCKRAKVLEKAYKNRDVLVNCSISRYDSETRYEKNLTDNVKKGSWQEFRDDKDKQKIYLRDSKIEGALGEYSTAKGYSVFVYPYDQNSSIAVKTFSDV